jgi:dTDP-4-dehydrorhamnose 3,5-epimerase
MDITSLEIPEVKLIKPKMHFDSRGYFTETYNYRMLKSFGITCEFVQDNQSLSREIGTIRGLHFQAPPATQAKLVRVVAGSIFDVAVDIRRGSATYGQWCGATLTEGGEQLFIPHGFAHGFCTLAPNTTVAYKVDDYYSAERSSGIIWNDVTLGIRWPLTSNEVTLSASDRNLLLFSEIATPFSL